MAIHVTQVPMYTNIHYFCIFQIFLYEKQNKPELKRKTKENKLNKAMHKTKLTQNNKAKHTSNANIYIYIYIYEGGREKVTESLRAIFLPHLGRAFPLSEPLNRQ